MKKIADTEVSGFSSESKDQWRYAAVCVLVVTALFWCWSASDQIIAPILARSLLMLSANILLAGIVALVLTAIFKLIFARRHRRPLLFAWSAVFGLVLLGTLGGGASPLGWYGLVVLVLLLATCFGLALWQLIHGTGRLTNKAYKKCRGIFIAAAIGPLVAAAWLAAWLVDSGSSASPVAASSEPSVDAIARLDAPNPSHAGIYKVGRLSYGSGQDKRRLEFGKGATITTAPVDGSRLITGWHGTSGAARTALWGFDEKHLPLNGRVWYPQAEGRFPLVLMVHGNNSAVLYSDQGLAYLGELLASQGFIAVSVDENFFNTSLIDKTGGLSGVNAARGWLLLEHLKLWQSWQSKPGNPMAGKTDMDNIALLGHSRGGEAVAVAADFNRRQQYPDDRSFTFDYNFNIRSLVAIAPSEGQYLPDGKPLQLRDVNYLALQGSHDADVTNFGGQQQFERISFSGQSDFIKASAYVYRANHGQFNTAWNDIDVGQGLPKRFINTDALLQPEEQRQLAKVYVSAFLQATLLDRSAYKPLLQDYHAAARWLPRTTVVSRFADGRSVEFRGQVKSGRMEASLVERAPENSDARHDYRYIRFDATNDQAVAAAPVVEVRDTNGLMASVPTGAVVIRPQLERNYLKAPLPSAAAPSRPVAGTYFVPLADLKQVNSALDTQRIEYVSFKVDSLGQAVAIKNISLTR